LFEQIPVSILIGDDNLVGWRLAARDVLLRPLVGDERVRRVRREVEPMRLDGVEFIAKNGGGAGVRLMKY
jgi:hypothetical protein